MGGSTDTFSDTFQALVGASPYPWQARLFHRFMEGQVPPTCAIPTGLGKTATIPIWLIALAQLARNGQASRLPRRLVYIVNRRTVVDQATGFVDGMAQQLASPATGPLSELTGALQGLASFPHEAPLGVSTLRGEHADNEDWMRDPARPAVIVGTVDMVGSRLLFQGYGSGRWQRSLHAGLLGQDTFFIHDEAHLTPAFGRLLRQVVEYARTGPRPVRVLEMSATQSAAEDHFQLGTEDQADPRVQQRVEAKKELHLDRAGKTKVDAGTLAGRAYQAHEGTGRSVVVYVHSVSDAASVARNLEKKVGRGADRVRLLTGTLRGYERDRLVSEDPVFAQFLPGHEPAEATHYLVATAAGEVGIDLDADDAVMDTVPLDRLIQRLGRINRTGGRAARVDLLAPEKPKEEVVNQTLDLLGRLPATLEGGLEASPEALSRLPEEPGYQSAIAAAPRSLLLEPHLLDLWSLTTLRPLEAPPVAPWLHGQVEGAEAPETWLAWRALLPPDPADDAQWLTLFPVRAQERARLPTYQAREFLATLGPAVGQPLLLVTADGEVRRAHPEELTDRELAYATIILPSEAGGLSHGIPDPKSEDPVPDVSTEADREAWVVHWDPANEQWVARSATGEGQDLASEGLGEAVSELASARGQRLLLRSQAPAEEGGTEAPEATCLWLGRGGNRLPDDRDAASFATREQALEDHLEAARAWAETLGRALELPPAVVQSLAEAGAWHDRGKARPWWQAAIGNHGDPPLAKSGGARFDQAANQGYRHELGSLLEAEGVLDAEGSTEDRLTLHLLAAHHGYARPGFPERAYDRQHALPENRAAVQRALGRFAYLQREYGWWGLAYLEALLKGADVLAGRDHASHSG